MTTRTDVAVVGAGPAGLSAAAAAAERGCSVVLFDMNPTSGGQLIKQIHKFFGSRDHWAGTRGVDIATRLLDQARERGVEVIQNHEVSWIHKGVVWAFPGSLGSGQRSSRSAQSAPSSIKVHAEKIILATGGIENTIAFPGWTLPGVMGAGAAQTMANLWRVLPGRRVLMVGAGNVGLIVSYQLLQAGAEVVAIVEAQDRIGGYAVHASKLARAGVPILTQHTVVRATGCQFVENAEIARLDSSQRVDPQTLRQVDVDTICLAVGLRPNARLAAMAGCGLTYSPILGGWLPAHDAALRTSQPDIYVAGDVSGIEEASTALEEGRLAGLYAAGSLGRGHPRDAQTIREAESRLHDLRSGPFGHELAQAKEGILAARAGAV